MLFNAGTSLPERNWKGTAVPFLNSFLIVGGSSDNGYLGKVLLYRSTCMVSIGDSCTKFRGAWEEIPTVGLNGSPYTGGLFWPRRGAAAVTLPSC